MAGRGVLTLVGWRVGLVAVQLAARKVVSLVLVDCMADCWIVAKVEAGVGLRVD